MRSDNLNVFDFDGTLVKVNSFKKINKRFLVTLIAKFKITFFIKMAALYIIRKCGVLSHLAFKRQVVNIFEQALTEQEKKRICQAVFDEHVNPSVFQRMIDMDNCIICTTAPFAYMSRLSFGKDVVIISSLDSANSFPDKGNFGPAKVVNLKAYFKGKDIQVANFFTDNRADDSALIDLCQNAFIVKGDTIKKIK
jgi:hypothetical protein